MSHAFEVAREIDLPASPEDVWTAITAAPAAWMFPTGMEVPAGGTPPEGAPIAAWDPPHHLVIRTESADGTFNALDYWIEAREGGTARLRYVHSGILADEWEDQYDAIGAHTDFYLHTLGEYLEHFNGRPVTYVGQPSAGIMGPAEAGAPGAMDVLRDALGVAADAAVGDDSQREAWRSRHSRRRDRLRHAGVPRHPHERRAVPVLRAQSLRQRCRHERAPVRRRCRRTGDTRRISRLGWTASTRSDRRFRLLGANGEPAVDVVTEDDASGSLW